MFAAYRELYHSVRRLLPEGADAERRSRNARGRLLLSLVNWMRKWIGRFEPDDYLHAGERMSDILIGGLARGPRACGQGVSRTRLAEQPVIGAPAVPAFLRAATAQVNEQGYHGASVTRIAAQLNLTKGSFYHHYASKDELVAACFERTFDVIRDSIAGDRANRLGLGSAGGDGADAGAVSAFRARTADEVDGLECITRSDANRQPAPLRPPHRAAWRFHFEGMLEGTIRTLEPAIAAQQVAGMINAASQLSRWVTGISPDNVTQLYVQPLFDGILSAG